MVATDDARIAEAVAAVGGCAILTRNDHPSGTDRIHEALETIDPDGRHDIVVNLQGDLPTLDPAIVAVALVPLADPDVALSTLVAVIRRDEERSDASIVKLVGTEVSPGRLRALYFTRATAPWGDGPLHHHIGLYGFRRAALRRFVALPPSPLERREKLEQLRAIEAGMRIDAMVVDTVPLGVDNPAELARARAQFEHRPETP